MMSSEKFSVVVADCPWPFKNRGTRAAAENHYSTMTMRDIMRLPVDRAMAEDSILFMWVTDTHLFTEPFNAGHVIRAWGFEPKATIQWLKIKDGKVQIGLGNLVRHAHESCIIATRGKYTDLIDDKSIPSFFWAPRGEHSEKPEELQTIVEKLVGFGPRLELFARRQRPGWVCVGDDMPDALPRSVERFLGVDGPLGVLFPGSGPTRLETLFDAGVGGKVTAHVANGEVDYLPYSGGNAERAQMEDYVRAMPAKERAALRAVLGGMQNADAVALYGDRYDESVTTSLDDPNYEDPDPEGADDPDLEMGRKA